MRFVCDKCKAKYSISDEKVRGKILKIRCKKCNNIIEVRDPNPPVAHPSQTGPTGQTGQTGLKRGASDLLASVSAPKEPTPSQPAAAPPLFDESGEATQISSPGLLDELRLAAAEGSHQTPAQPALVDWFIAINDDPKGPVTKEQIRGYITTGKANSESLVWREGYDDWRPLRESSELRDLLRTSRAFVSIAAPPSRHKLKPIPTPPPESPPVQNRPDSGGVIAAPSSSSQAAVSPPAPDPLRGQHVGKIGARTASAPEPSQPNLTPIPAPPQAKEPSLPDFAPPPATPAPSAPEPRHTPPPAPIATADSSGITSAVASAPSLVPVHPVRKSRKQVVFALGGIGAIILGVISAIVVIRMGNEPQAASNPTEQQVATQDPPVNNRINRNKNLLEVPVLTNQPEVPRPDETAEKTVPPPPPETKAVSTSTEPRNSKKSSKNSERSEKNQAKTLTEEQRRMMELAKGLGDENPAPILQKKTGNGLSGNGGRSGGQPLSSDQIRSTVGKNMSSVRRCYEREMRGSRGSNDLRVMVRINVQPSGVVSGSKVTSPGVRGTGLATCIERAIKRWRFPNASAPSKIDVPFVLTPGR